jgi:ABC-type sugar transport system substrate-binding protein
VATLALLTLASGWSATVVAQSPAPAGDLFSQTVEPPPGDAAEQLAFYQQWAEEAQQPATAESILGTPPLAITPDKRIMIIICTAAGQGCVLQGNGGEQAADAVGWQHTTIDGQGSSQVQSDAIRQAIVQGYDGIYMAVVDQLSVAAALSEACAAGIRIVTSISGNTPGDCPNAVFASVDAPDFEVGRDLAAWVIAEANGEPVKTAVIYLSLAGVNLFRAQGYVAQMNACDWCEIIGGPQTYTIQTINDLPNRVQSLLQANPDIDYIFMDVGPWVTYIVQGMQATQGLADDMTIVSTDCVPDQIARMAAREPYAEICHGYASVQAGWGAVDELNRAFQDQPRGGDKVGIQLFTSDTIDQIVDATIGYDADGLDYRSLYLESWGLQPGAPAGSPPAGSPPAGSPAATSTP